MKRLDVEAPVEGLNRAVGFSDQPTRTSRDMQNMAVVDPKTNRVRLTSRAGMLDFLDTPASAGSAIRRMESIVVDEHRLTYDYAADPTSHWTSETPNLSSARCVFVDLAGDVYWIDDDSGWIKTNSSGVVLWKQPITLPSAGASATFLLTALVVDDAGSVYVSTGHYSGSFVASTYTNSRIWKWRIADDGHGYQLAWELNPANYLIPHMRIKDGVLYALAVNWSLAAGSRTTSVVWYDDILTDTPPENTNGMPPAERQTLLPNATVLDGTHDVIGHSFAIRSAVTGLEFAVCGTDGTSVNQSRFLCKVDNLGTVKWNKKSGDGASTFAPGTGAIGYGVEFNSDGDVITLGQYVTGDLAWLRKYTDAGTSVSTAWSKTDTGTSILYEYPRFQLDSRDTIYVPHYQTLVSSTTRAVRVFNTSGTELTSTILTSSYPGSAANNICMATAIPPSDAVNEPLFREDDKKISEFVYCASVKASGVPPMQQRRLLSVAYSAGSRRTLKFACVQSGNIKVFSRSGGFVLPTNGSAALDSTAQYISSATLYGKTFFTDGIGVYRYLDPRPSVANPNGIVREFLPTSSGTFPPRARLFFTWRARLCMGRTPDDPHNIYACAAEDPFNIEFSPIVPSFSDAMAFNLTDAGKVPDLPNSFCPYNDDTLIVFCDHSIWVVRGNPLRGAEIDHISSITGGSFGKCWCIDPSGNIYFHGSRGGIFVMTPNSAPLRISVESIDADLATLDLSSYFVELTWDDRNQALNVWVLPYGSGGTPIRHWSFSTRTKAWIPHKYGLNGATGVQPVAVLVADGDEADDRVILVAGEDGHVGYIDQDARDDRGTPVYSYALIGPIVNRSESIDVSRITMVEVTLASDREGCGLEVFCTDQPDDLGLAVFQGKLDPGFNRFYVSARGRYIFLRLFRAATGTFALESAVVRVASAGRVRL